VKTVTLVPIAIESGTVFGNGTLSPQFRIGDNPQNVGGRPFFSYDITEFAGGEIKDAKLTFTVSQVAGNPWLISPFLYVDSVDYGTQQLSAAAFNVPTLTVIESYNSHPPAEIIVKTYLEQALANSKPRFQVRLRLGSDMVPNGFADFIEFSKVELTVTYVK